MAVRLVEERGVAAFPYRKAIDNILQWVRDLAKGMKPGDSRGRMVPNKLTSKIDFINELKMRVFIVDGENYAKEHGGGEINLRVDDELDEDGKYKYGEIIIYAFSYYGVLYDRTILNSLYHELNHFYEAWKELTKTNSMSLFAKGVEKANAKTYAFKSDIINQCINEIIYRLFSESEFNALVSGVYGDLQGLKSTRENFSEDILKTQAYGVYNTIKKNLPYLITYFKNNLDDVPHLFSALKYHGIEFNPYTKGPMGYIKEFNRRTKYLLKCLIRGIGRTASLYYDSIEVPDDNVKLTIK